MKYAAIALAAALAACTSASPPQPDAAAYEPPPPPPPPSVGSGCSADSDCAGGAKPMFCIEKTQIVALIPPVCTVACKTEEDCSQAAIGVSGWSCAIHDPEPKCVPDDWLDP